MPLEILQAQPFAWNLAISWLWVFLGFVSGAILGLGFDKEKWLGGYASWKRRLYRLGHISFFGTGILNLMFFVTVAATGLHGALATTAGWAFLLGALTMPIACFTAGSLPKLKPVFYIPVLALLTGGIITTLEVLTL